MSSSMRFLLLAIVCSLSFTPGFCQKEEGGKSTFCYDGDCAPRYWGGQCSTGSGQSPIDIRDNGKNNVGTGILYFTDVCWQDHNFILENNGHTAEASIGPNRTSRCFLSGDGEPDGILGRSYVFSQVHFHWGSDTQGKNGTEHSFNGITYALEAHFVHFSSEYKTLEEAVSSNQPRSVAVVAVIFQLTNKDNEALTPIIKALRQLKRSGDKTKGYGLNLMDILRPTNGKTYLTRYEGSLTTPQCAEVVSWVVFNDPRSFVSPYQLKVFRSILDQRERTLENNVRPTQAINDRRIRFFRTSIAYRELYAMEGHFVHYSSEFNSLNDALASNQSGALSVVAVLYQVSQSENQAFNPILNVLSQVVNSGNSVQGTDLNLWKLLPQQPGKIYNYQYDGSLTTPSCNEVVLWNVLISESHISQQQLTQFRKAIDSHEEPMENNFRPIQALNNRIIRVYESQLFSQ
ncbi:unnamed protein product [Allacma fusca]|uniref:Alpha-carbonic anhydrase domain-containing protein n=1 Tax=Allacma fusca TaxID=39272 RepID=A0A8J2KUX3_9HEXA|nr:unnamed protein product [Allacma fusca]